MGNECDLVFGNDCDLVLEGNGVAENLSFLCFKLVLFEFA